MEHGRRRADQWLVADDESLIVTEGHRVARFVDGSLLWVTKPISPHGIHLTAITDEEVSGVWYYPTIPARTIGVPSGLPSPMALYWRARRLSSRMNKPMRQLVTNIAEAER